MNNLTVKTVPFMGTDLCAAQDNDGQIWVGVSYICNGIGLTEGQIKNERLRIQRDAVLVQGGRNFILPTNGGNQETLCIGLNYLPLWLAKISITPRMQEEQPDAATNLIQYQLNAKDVLAEAFIKKPPTSMEDILIYQLQEMKAVKSQMSALDSKVDGIREIVALNPNDWRKESRALVVKIAQSLGGNDFIRDIQHEIFSLVDERARVDLGRRLTNKRQRMALEGVSKSQRDKANKLDIIAEDRKLIEIYIAVVKDMAIRHGINDLAPVEAAI